MSEDPLAADIHDLLDKQAHIVEQGHVEWASLHEDHLKRSKQAINSAIDLAKEVSLDTKPRVALVLGPGPAADIPLEELARSFDRVDLVEYAPDVTRRAVAALPKDLQEKCNVIQADLTAGITTKIPTEWGHLLEEKYSHAATDPAEYSALLRDMQKQIDALEIPPVTIPGVQDGAYALVVSQLITSQLMLPAESYFGVLFPVMTAVELLRVQHFSLMDKAALPGGIIYWADTPTMQHTFPDGTVDQTVIARTDIPEQFTWEPLMGEKWTYARSPIDLTQNPPEPARSFGVEAYILKK